MKNLKSIVLLLILFALPAASWYFLKGGLDWRKSKVVELAPKERFLNVFNFTNKDKDALFEIMTHKTCVVKFKEDLTELDQTMIDQFRNAHTFQFVLMSKTVDQPNEWSSKSVERYYKPQSMATKLDKYANSNYVIVDTAGFIRQYYKGDSKATLTSIIEDMAVILPRKKEKDIKMKNNKNNQ